MIHNYRKKPVVVQAVQWNGRNLSEVSQFCEGAARVEIYDAAWKAGVAPPGVDLTISTLEGPHHASVGDYIIKGVNGEFYPCKPDIFKKTYEPAEEGER